MLSVGTTPVIAANILPPAIREFRSQRPDLDIRLFDADLDTVLKRVEAGKLDMGLGSYKRVPGVRRTPFFRFSLVLIRAAKDDAIYPAAYGSKPYMCLLEADTAAFHLAAVKRARDRSMPSSPRLGMPRVRCVLRSTSPQLAL